MSEKTIRHLHSIPWKSIFQRLPGVWLLCMIPFAIMGPVYVPTMFALYYTALHLLFFLNNCRSAYGMFVAYQSAKLSATTDWVQKYCDATGASDENDPSHDLPYAHVVHVIILPNYSEDMDTLCETLDVLASHSIALTQYKVCLAMEESEAGSETKARTLQKLYQDHFLDIVYTIHPRGRPNEIRGKSSNVAWAAQQMALRGAAGIVGRHDHEVITVMDADTCFAEDYFKSVNFKYCVASPEQRKIMMFAPCTVFDRNSGNVPIFVRVTDMFWSIGVISNLYAASAIKLPCSAYSVSMDLAIAVGFWDAGPEAIGEDLHMYLKCFFATGGNVIVNSIFSPASQCNVEGNGRGGISGYVSGLKARYVQAKRHLWGSLDTGYTLRKGIFNLLFPGYETTIQLKNAAVDKIGKNDKQATFSVSTLLLLMHRLIEAHILMGQLFLLIIISSVILPVRSSISYDLAAYFWALLSNAPVHPYVQFALSLSFWIRLACLIPNIMMIKLYESYYRFVGFERWVLQEPINIQKSLCSNINAVAFKKMKNSDVLGGKKVQHIGKRASLYSAREYPRCLLDWFVIPFAGFMFYVMPQFHAQISHLWTDSLEYKVAAKPQTNRAVVEDISLAIDMEVKSASSKGDEGYFEEFSDSKLSSSNGSLNVTF